MTLALWESYTECGDMSMMWVLRKKEHLAGKVDLASEIITEGEVDPKFMQGDMVTFISYHIFEILQNLQMHFTLYTVGGICGVEF